MRETCNRCDHCPIRHRGICGALSDEHLHRLALISRTRSLAPHQSVFHDGDEVLYYSNIRSGIVKLTKTLADGRLHIVGLLFPPDFLGSPFNASHKYGAEAATELELCYFPKSAFQRLMIEFPGLEHRLFEFAVRELDVCRDWNLLLGRKSSYERVASFVYMMAKRAADVSCAPKPANQAHFLLPLTRGEMADYLGLTLETVSRQFSRLKDKGIIDLPTSRDVTVPDMELLSAISNIESCGQVDMDQGFPPLANIA